MGHMWVDQRQRKLKKHENATSFAHNLRIHRTKGRFNLALCSSRFHAPHVIIT
jgi:hypothetical protein